MLLFSLRFPRYLTCDSKRKRLPFDPSWQNSNASFFIEKQERIATSNLKRHGVIIHNFLANFYDLTAFDLKAFQRNSIAREEHDVLPRQICDTKIENKNGALLTTWRKRWEFLRIIYFFLCSKQLIYYSWLTLQGYNF